MGGKIRCGFQEAFGFQSPVVLVCQFGPQDICMEFPKPIFAAEEVVKVPSMLVSRRPKAVIQIQVVMIHNIFYNSID